ncbi:hypothetical protein FACS1894211_14350 [Clostridia bacterium]|nr:hypothetical protein FACS1894211_14350 [Clostridia bacterium]
MTIKLNVTGMSCPHCERAVEAAAGAVAGVKSVKASAKKGIAEVKYDGSAQTRESIANAIRRQGYGVGE